MDYEQLKKINRGLRKTNIKGKDYVDVATRLQAFRQMYPEGCIETVRNKETPDDVAEFEAFVRTEDGRLLATGHAREVQSSSMINKTSFVENAETSAIGRALGHVGIGSTQSIASVEELTSAMAAQEVIAQTDKVIDAIIDIAGGDRERVNTYVGNLFPGNRLEDLDYETLVRLKKDIAKKIVQQPETVTNFNITRRAR